MARDLNEAYTPELRQQAYKMLAERGLPISGDNLQRAMMLLMERPDIGDDIAAAQSPQMSSQLLHYIESGTTDAPPQSVQAAHQQAASAAREAPVPQQKPQRAAQATAQDDEVVSGATADAAAAPEKSTLERSVDAQVQAGRPPVDAADGGNAAAQMDAQAAENDPQTAQAAPAQVAQSRGFSLEDILTGLIALLGARSAGRASRNVPSTLSRPVSHAGFPTNSVLNSREAARIRAIRPDLSEDEIVDMITKKNVGRMSASDIRSVDRVQSPRLLESPEASAMRRGRADREAARNDPRALDMEGGY